MNDNLKPNEVENRDIMRKYFDAILTGCENFKSDSNEGSLFDAVLAACRENGVVQ